MRVNLATIDDPAAIVAGDPADMLAAVASAGAQVRDGLGAADPGDLGPRPRALIVVGMGGSAAAGDVLVAAAGNDCPIPVLVHRGSTLPGWIGPEDLVVGVSCSGHTEETLGAVSAAIARGTRLVTIGGSGSPLAELAKAAGTPHLEVDAGGRQPRASLWSLATPLLMVAEALGVVPGARASLTGAASVLDGVAAVSRAEVESSSNRAKQLAAHLAGGLPMIWGAPGVGAAVANRFACQIAENAKVPAVSGALSEPHHNQIVAFAGAFAGSSAVGEPGLRLVVVGDADEPVGPERRIAESLQAAQDAGVPAVALRGSGPDALAGLAGLIALIDFASVYLALAVGVDPTPVAPIDALKARMAAGNEGDR